MRNVELLEETLQFIKDNPDKHDQETFCGTAQCFAGWAVALEGWSMSDLGGLWVEKDGEVRDVDDLAQELLGINQAEADNLFSGGNNIADLELMVKDLVNGSPLRDRMKYWAETADAGE